MKSLISFLMVLVFSISSYAEVLKITTDTEGGYSDSTVIINTSIQNVTYQLPYCVEENKEVTVKWLGTDSERLNRAFVSSCEADKLENSRYKKREIRSNKSAETYLCDGQGNWYVINSYTYFIVLKIDSKTVYTLKDTAEYTLVGVQVMYDVFDIYLPPNPHVGQTIPFTKVTGDGIVRIHPNLGQTLEGGVSSKILESNSAHITLIYNAASAVHHPNWAVLSHKR